MTVNEWAGGFEKEGVGPLLRLPPDTPPAPPPPPAPRLLRSLLTPGERVPSTLLRARSAAQLLQHFPLAKIVLFNEHAEAAFRPRFFICFPQTRKEKNRWGDEEGIKKKSGGLEGGGREEGACTHRNTCGDSRTHTHAHTEGRTIRNGRTAKAEPRDWSGEVWATARVLFY